MSIFQYYEYFYKVAVTGNMTKAAKQLYISQPALSKAISKIERQLNCQLFVRSQKGVRLTVEGEILLQNVKQTYSLLNDTRQKIESFQSSTTTEVRIGVGRDLLEIYVLPRLEKMFSVYPTARIHFSVIPTNTIFRQLEDNLLDIGITTQPIYNNLFTNHKLFDLNDCFIVGERYAHLADDHPHSIYEIANYPLIMLPRNSLSRQHVDGVLQTYGITAVPLHQMADTKIIAKFVKYGFGVGCVCEPFVKSLLDAGSIKKIELIEKLPSRQASLIHNIHAPLNDAALLLLKFLKEEIK